MFFNKKVQILFNLVLILLWSYTAYPTTYTTIASGDWSNSGTWSGGSIPPTTITNNDVINITNGHSVTLTGNLTFNNNCELNVDGYLEIVGDVTVNNNLDLTVDGFFVIEGSFDAHNNAVVDITGNITITEDCTFNNNAALDVDGSFSIYGDFTGGNNNNVTGTGELNVNGTVSGINTSGYGGTVTSGYSTQKGLVNNGCIIKIGSNDVIYIDGDANGDFSNMFANGENGRVDSDGTIILEGDWNNLAYDSVFINTDGNGTVIFKGTTQQTLGGSNITDFEHLTVNNSTGVVLDENVLINQTLTFTDGEITTGSTDTVIVENTAEAAIVSQDVGKSVNGNLRRYMVSGSFSFPLSDGTNYCPAIIDITNVGSMNYVSAKYVQSTVTAPGGLSVNGTEITEFLDNGYWSFSPDDGTGVEYDITLTSRGHSNGGAEAAQHAVFRRESTIWESVGDHSNATQSGTGTDPITAKRTNITGFSDFVIGKSESFPLSVELVNFEAICRSNHVGIVWQTVSEYNNESFKIMHSEDGVEFRELDRITGNGTTNELISYSYVHNNPSYGVNYYKLVQIDYDGFESESQIISGACEFTAIRNLNTLFEGNKIHISFISDFEMEFLIQLYDPLSRLIYRRDFTCIQGENSIEINFSPKVVGVYIVNLTNSMEEHSKKIIVK